MSLITGWGDYNKEEKTLLDERYTVRTSTMEVGATKVLYFVTTRTATKSYSFIGMNHETALRCLASRIDMYTRSYYRPKPKVIGETIEEVLCGASINARHDHDGSWRVDIEVNETDEVSTLEPSDYPKDLFSDIVRGRAYDGD